MSRELSIEAQIRKAIEAGEFDNLEGKGRPIDLSAYFAAPEDVRLGYSLLKSNNFVPEEVERLKEIGKIREAIAACPDEDKKKGLTKALQEKSIALSLILERNKRKR
jgi:Domain of unknown function (DUF1992)